MLVTTLDGIAGRITEETMGVVRGTSLWTRRITKSCYGGIRHMHAHGLQDIDEGLKLAKEEANKAMTDQARQLGADAVVGLRIDVVEMSNGVFCVTCTGTAVKTVKLPQHLPSLSTAAPAAEDFAFDYAFMAGRPSSEGSALRH